MDVKEKVALAAELMKDGDVAYERRWEIFGYLFDGLEAGIPEAASLLASAYTNGHMAEESLRSFCAYNALSKDMKDPEGLYVWATDSHYLNRTYSLSLLKESADLGYPLAAYEYARMMESVNPYQSEKYYQIAVDGEVYIAAYRYAMFKKSRFINDDDKVEVFNLMKLAAEHEIPEAFVHLGKMYDFGYGTEINYEEARKWYEQALNTFNCGGANALLARHYIYGYGVEVDLEKGIKLLQDAIEYWNPDPIPFYELARCYELGLGVEQNLEMAKELRERGAKTLIEKK